MKKYSDEELNAAKVEVIDSEKENYKTPWAIGQVLSIIVLTQV